MTNSHAARQVVNRSFYSFKQRPTVIYSVFPPYQLARPSSEETRPARGKR